MTPSELYKQKIIGCRSKLLQSYLSDSIVEEAVNAIDYETIHENLHFLKFGIWHYIPRNWFTDPSIYPDMVFTDFGRGIAIGEEKHIVEKILTNDDVKRVTLDTLNYENIVEAVNSLVSEVQRPLSTLHFSLFVPIEYMVAMYTDWMRDPRIRIRFLGRNELVANHLRMKLFWSSKYVDYDEFIILEKSLCRWIAKPNVNNRLEVEIRESNKPGKMEVKAQTVFNFTILDPEKITVLLPTQPPPEPIPF